jgi:hypothetical protein
VSLRGLLKFLHFKLSQWLAFSERLGRSLAPPSHRVFPAKLSHPEFLRKLAKCPDYAVEIDAWATANRTALSVSTPQNSGEGIVQ